MVERALVVVVNATAKVQQLTQQLRARDATIEQLRQNLASAHIEVESTQDGVNKLEARFTKVLAIIYPDKCFISMTYLRSVGLRLSPCVEESFLTLVEASVPTGMKW